MSDFDKEAEREKLREKYEREQSKREATERMSELLLQGATMTNAHCSECGDPIFRYDGQEFCPTCEKPVERDTGEDVDSDDGATDDEPATADAAGDREGPDGDRRVDGEEIEVTAPTDDARVQFGGDGEEGEAASGAVSPGGPDGSPDETGTEAGGQADGRSRERAATAGARERQADRLGSSAPARPERNREVPGVEPAGDGVTVARESLVRTLARFSEQAEAADDPQRAREYLAAAREAAEALSALRR